MADMKVQEEYMRLALSEAMKSLAAGDFPVGCVIVDNGEVVAAGRRKNSTGPAVNELDHAEVTALREYIRNRPASERGELTVYSTMEPCLMCYATLLLNGARTFVYGYEDVMGGGCGIDRSSLPSLYRLMEVTVVPGVLRRECLALFRQFYQDPRTRYLSGSELAEEILTRSGREAREGEDE